MGNVDVEGARVDVDEHRLCADNEHNFGRSREGERRQKYGIPGTHARRHQCHHEGIGTARTTDGVLRARKLAERGFKLGDFRTVDEPAVIEHRLNACVDFGVEELVLGGEIDERDVAQSRVSILSQGRAPQVSEAPPGHVFKILI